MKHLLWVVGLIALGPAAYFLYRYSNATSMDDSKEAMPLLVYAGIFFLIALVCFAVFFFMRFRAEGDQDISITKF
jgi:hypothetical protein